MSKVPVLNFAKKNGCSQFPCSGKYLIFKNFQFEMKFLSVKLGVISSIALKYLLIQIRNLIPSSVGYYRYNTAALRDRYR
jgi:hypothetical protein